MCPPWCAKNRARHSRSDVILCRNENTAGSPAYGDHCNASARLEFLLGGVFTISVSSCMFVFDSSPSCTWLLFWLGLFLIRSRRNTVRSPFRTKRNARGKDWTGLEWDARNKRLLSARWIGKRRYCNIRMIRHTKAKRKQKQQMQVFSWVPLLSGAVFMLFIVSWETGLLGERVGEAAVTGPPNTGGSNPPTKPCDHCDAWMSSNSALWRQCKRFHQHLSVEAYPQCPEQEESDSDTFVLGRECPGDSDHDESLDGRWQKSRTGCWMKIQEIKLQTVWTIAITLRQQAAEERASVLHTAMFLSVSCNTS